MKTLFAVIMLVACATVQANANVNTFTTDPKWLKDMQVVSCKFGMCKNWATQVTWDDEGAPDGYTVVFPPEYSPDKLKAISNEVVEWVRVHGIPHP